MRHRSDLLTRVKKAYEIPQPLFYDFIIYTHIYKSMIRVNIQIIFTSILPPKDEHDDHNFFFYLHIELELVFFSKICKTLSIFIESLQHVAYILSHEFTQNDMFQKLNSACHLNLSITLRIRK